MLHQPTLLPKHIQSEQVYRMDCKRNKKYYTKSGEHYLFTMILNAQYNLDSTKLLNNIMTFSNHNRKTYLPECGQ